MLEELPRGTGELLSQLLLRVLERASAIDDPTPPDVPQQSVASGAEPALAKAVSRLAAAVRSGNREELSRACLEVADWAEADKALQTATVFVDTAVSLQPDHPLPAYRAGRLARWKAEHHAAEKWYGEAISLGEQSGDWAVAALAWAGMGNLYRQRGNLPAAAEAHLQSLWMARTNGLKDLEGDALHNLCVIAFEREDTEGGLAYAEKAVEVFGRRRSRIVGLANDLAWYWMTQEGAFKRALPIFQELLQDVKEPLDRLYVAANVARAAGGAGNGETFREASAAVWATLPELPDGLGHAPALVDVAHGAASLKDWEEARRAALEARDIAGARGEGKVRLEAEAILDHSLAGGRHGKPGSAPRERAPDWETRVDMLAEAIVQRLRATPAGA